MRDKRGIHRPEMIEAIVAEQGVLGRASDALGYSETTTLRRMMKRRGVRRIHCGDVLIIEVRQ